jgi:hypothetical protein
MENIDRERIRNEAKKWELDGGGRGLVQSAGIDAA